MIKGVIDLIKADATFISLVGNYKGAAKITPVVAEQEAPKPYTTIRRISQGSTIVKGQPSDKDAPIFTVTACATTYEKCIEILTAVRNILDDYKGTSGGVVYHRIWYQNSEDLFDSNDKSFIVIDTYEARCTRVVT